MIKNELFIKEGMARKELYKVRGVYYDPSRGLFLIESEKSKTNNRLTTPGGKLNEGESFSDGLARLTMKEIGIHVTWIDYAPFFSEKYSARGEEYKTLAYRIKISSSLLTGHTNGLTPNGTKFRFMNLAELTTLEKSLTMSTKQIVSSKEFIESITKT